jgi:aryl-alcohol dehydrogenase-like predicted oxidoreductase
VLTREYRKIRFMTSPATNATFKIGREMEINRLGYGAMQLVGPYAYGPPPAGIEPTAILRRAIDLGINFIDTSNLYGPRLNERQISEALHPYAKGLVIGTKGGLTRVQNSISEFRPVNTPEHLRWAIEGSLRRLKLDCIALYQLHRSDPQIPIEDAVGTLSDLKNEGKLRHIGLSEVTVEQIERARRVAPIATIQNHYNIHTRVHDDVLRYCEVHGIGFIPWYPLSAGAIGRSRDALRVVAGQRGLSPIQIALSWLFAKSPVMILIPGTSSISHLAQNTAAPIRLSPEEMALLDQDSTSSAHPG